MKENVKRFLIMSFSAILLASIFMCSTFYAHSKPVKPINKQKLTTEFYKKIHEGKIISVTYNDSTMSVNHVKDNADIKLRDSLKQELYNEVDKYIDRVAPNAHNELHRYLVDNALEYDIDLCFMMAQTCNETGFGTAGAGRASSRRSLFGVCSKRYPSYEAAVKDYCQLVRTKYMGSRKTEYDLMKNYVTLGGARYAGSRDYERKLSATYNKIKNATNIYNLQTQIESLS